MTAAHARRGRPKGSGINDEQRLVEMSRLIETDKRMKPTTAIKALGITDPSAIRRLRDKYNLLQNERPGTTAPQFRNGPSALRTAPTARATPLNITDPIRRAAPQPQPTLQSTPGSQSTPAKPHPIKTAGLAAPLPMRAANTNQVPVAAMLFGFGLNAAAALFEQQMMLAQSVMKLPPIRELFRQQIAFTEFMLDVASHSPGPRNVH